ncbi:hypothetical protein R3P38DRAFT_3451495 [Favolaschia claudopus]|uniref:Major sperm protein n=1 Tax=Favolaschia claudopus TaxID=2862362 RepID=A0AAV9ZKR9_9AGAR
MDSPPSLRNPPTSDSSDSDCSSPPALESVSPSLPGTPNGTLSAASSDSTSSLDLAEVNAILDVYVSLPVESRMNNRLVHPSSGEYIDSRFQILRAGQAVYASSDVDGVNSAPPPIFHIVPIAHKPTPVRAYTLGPTGTARRMVTICYPPAGGQVDSCDILSHFGAAHVDRNDIPSLVAWVIEDKEPEPPVNQVFVKAKL